MEKLQKNILISVLLSKTVYMFHNTIFKVTTSSQIST